MPIAPEPKPIVTGFFANWKGKDNPDRPTKSLTSQLRRCVGGIIFEIDQKVVIKAKMVVFC